MNNKRVPVQMGLEKCLVSNMEGREVQHQAFLLASNVERWTCFPSRAKVNLIWFNFEAALEILKTFSC